MKIRLLLVALAALAVPSLAIPQAQAASGPPRLQKLAAAQTQLLFRFYNGQPQPASPPRCNQGQHEDSENGVFLLPTLSFGSGDVTFTCRTEAHAVLVDLGGAVAAEDRRGDTYELVNGEILDFARKNLQRICDDAIRYFSPATASLDNHAITGTPVVTRNFTIKVNPGAEPYFQDSIDLGHPGKLTACYVGYKALVPVSPGHHVLRVDLSAVAGTATHFTYKLNIERD
jgi:hypothetical protein